MATERQLIRYLRNDAARHQRDIPKRQRPRRVIEPTRPMADCQQVLGHAPRGRKGKARR